ncbi:MAG: response regulator [Acetivibrio sp.]
MIQVLIVEDETILRKGITTLIHWKELGCELIGDCANGRQAMEFMQKHTVDILITDIKMPEVDGLQLCEYTKKTYPQVQMILLTAFASFPWAQKAIGLGIRYYIVKTNFYSELPIAIKETVDVIFENRKKPLPPEDESFKRLIFTDIIEQSIYEKSQIAHWFSYFHLPMENYYITILEVTFPKQQEENREEKQQYLLSFKNFFGLAFQKFQYFFVELKDNFFMILINFQEGRETENLQSLLLVCNEILSTVKNFMPFYLNIAVSAQQTSADNFLNAYQETINRLGCEKEKNTLSLVKKMEKQGEPSTLPSSGEVVGCLLKHLKGENQESIESYLSKTLFEYQQYLQDLDKTKVEILQVLFSFFRELTDSDINMDLVFEIEHEIYRRIMLSKSLNGMEESLNSMLEKISGSSLSFYEDTNYLVRMTNQIIEEKYRDLLKLDDIAGQLHVNSSYLSRLYKKETGSNLITALNGYRIKMACNFLKNKNFRISEVGQMVGIEDPAYFTSVFTKYKGISPQKFRDSKNIE